MQALIYKQRRRLFCLLFVCLVVSKAIPFAICKYCLSSGPLVRVTESATVDVFSGSVTVPPIFPLDKRSLLKWRLYHLWWKPLPSATARPNVVVKRLVCRNVVCHWT